MAGSSHISVSIVRMLMMNKNDDCDPGESGGDHCAGHNGHIYDYN